MSKQNVQYEGVTGHGVGIMSAEIELDHAMMTDSGSTTGTYDWTNPIPPYSLRLGCVVETLETYSAVCTVAVGITAAANEWTSATTGTCTTLGYKHVFPYGAATIITGQENTAAESVHITLTVADWTLITTGRIRVKVFFLATQVS